MAEPHSQSSPHRKQIWRTLRFRLAAWNALVVVVISLVMLLGVRQGVRWVLFHELDQMLQDEIREISLIIDDVGPNGLSLIQEDLQRKSRGHQLYDWFAEVFGSDGQQIWSSNEKQSFLGRINRSRNLIPYTANNQRILETTFAENPLGIGGLRIGASLELIQRDMSLLDRLMAIAAGVLIVVAPMCGYWLAGRAARTVGDIIQTASRLRPDYLGERLKIHGTGDELDQLSLTINGLLDRIASYLQLRREFIANAAHELRTPLAAIRSSIEVALTGSRSKGEYTSILEDLIDQSAALETLVNQMLLLSETEMTRGTESKGQERVPLHEVVPRAVDMFQGVAESRGIEMTLEAPAPVWVVGNRQHLRQVVNNLIDNAIKYTPSKGKIRVHLYEDVSSGQAKIIVEDNGIGISEEDLPHIFERFFRADRSRTRSMGIHGTGLGLSICQAVVMSAGGTITCKSKLNEGTTMEVTIPVASSSGDEGIPQASPGVHVG